MTTATNPPDNLAVVGARLTVDERNAIALRILFAAEPRMEALMARKGLLRGTGVAGETGFGASR